MVLAFMASSIALLALWPRPLPPEPEPLQAGQGVTHTEAVTQNLERAQHYKNLVIKRRVRLGCAVLAVAVIMRIGYVIGRRLE